MPLEHSIDQGLAGTARWEKCLRARRASAFSSWRHPPGLQSPNGTIGQWRLTSDERRERRSFFAEKAASGPHGDRPRSLLVPRETRGRKGEKAVTKGIKTRQAEEETNEAKSGQRADTGSAAHEILERRHPIEEFLLNVWSVLSNCGEHGRARDIDSAGDSCYAWRDSNSRPVAPNQVLRTLGSRGSRSLASSAVLPRQMT